MKILKLFLLFTGLLFWSLFTSAQSKTSLTEDNGDCSCIIDLLAADTVFGPTTAPVGPGKFIEISGEKNSLTSFEKEHHTVWYRFKVPYDATFTFEVIPQSIKDDYDFILYKYTGKNFCAEVTKKTTAPVRTCISRNDPKQGSCTGLKKGAEDDFIHSGPGASWCKPLPVKKGEVYVLVLDNVYPSGKGHTLKLHFSKKPAPVQPQVTEQVGPQVTVTPQQSKLILTIIDRTTKQPLKANVEIVTKKNPDGTPVFKVDSTNTAESALGLNTVYFVRTEAANYFGSVKEVKTTAVAREIALTIELDRIVAGKNVIFDNILFYGDQARFLPESTPSLQTLASTMNRNPKLVIEVQGHVNWPKMMSENNSPAMAEHNQELSEERAKAVVDYLRTNGVESRRMTWKGYGSTRMIYPDARSEEQMKQNRRVEIVIISNE